MPKIVREKKDGHVVVEAALFKFVPQADGNYLLKKRRWWSPTGWVSWHIYLYGDGEGYSYSSGFDSRKTYVPSIEVGEKLLREYYRMAEIENKNKSRGTVFFSEGELKEKAREGT